MSESAFGIEHGDVSKAFGGAFKMPKLGQAKGAGGAAKQVGQQKVGQLRQMGSGMKAGLGGSKPGVGAKKNNFNTGMRAGNFLQTNKKTIGGAGGGGAVLGGGGVALTGGMYNNRKKPGQ